MPNLATVTQHAQALARARSVANDLMLCDSDVSINCRLQRYFSGGLLHRHGRDFLGQLRFSEVLA